MKNLLTKVILPLVAIGLLVFAVYFVGSQDRSAPAVAISSRPPVSPYADTVAGAGLIEAQTENIAIGSPTPGVVVEVFVAVGQKVAAGDKLFRLDDRALQAELRIREAALANSKADLERLENAPRPEQLRSSEAQLAQAQANLIDQRDQYTRTRELYERKVETAQSLITRQQALHSAEAQVARAQAEYDIQKNGTWVFDLQVARSVVAQAESQLQQTTIELDRLIVRALVPGQVLQVNVRPGEFVGAPPGQALIVLGNIDQLHVRVDIDENDIPRFKPGSPGTAKLRGQPEIEFPLRFVRVEPYVVPKRSLTGDNTERVDTRVLQVIYAVEATGQPLYVGQQVDVYIQAPRGEPERAATAQHVTAPRAQAAAASKQ